MSLTRLVAITGCDSGLGWALAARIAREGLPIVAGMHQGTDTKAAQALRKLLAHPFPLDVTNPESVAGFHDFVTRLLKDNSNYKLHAVVNNAGVMTIGNYEWLTPKLAEEMINVNLLGSMRIVTAFLPDLRRNASDITTTSKPRIINVGSHCGLQPLPAFGVYSASKAGLLAWTRALRLEHRTQGPSVIAFVPGGFPAMSRLFSRQSTRGNEMIEHLSDDQKIMYETQIITLTNYITAANIHDARFNSMIDSEIIETFMKALTDDDPKAMYKVESWRYMFYYNLFKLPLPEYLHHWFIKKFLKLPFLQ